MNHGKQRQRELGFSTLVMMIALGVALSAALYGTYDRMQATGKLQNASTDRAFARALAADGTDSVAGYFNSLYCGGATAPCLNGNSAAVGAVPAGTVLINGQTVGNGTITATVLSNSFGTNGGYVEVRVVGNADSNAAISSLHSYMTASSIYTFTPLTYAFLINGSQNLTGSVAINTGSSALTVNGSLSIGGDASVTAAQATGDISGTCTNGSSACVENVSTPFTSPTINAYNLTQEANAVLALDGSGNPVVTFENNAALPSGTYPLSSATALNALCQGGASCISYSSGVWTVASQPKPNVLFFYGDLYVASGADGSNTGNTYGYNGLIATGNATIATNNNIVAYGQMPNVCQTAPVPTNICPNGPGSTATGPVANVVLLSGGQLNYPYPGANGIPAVGSMTASIPSATDTPSGTVTGYLCSSNGNSIGSTGTCPSTSTTTGILTGGNVVLQGNGNLTGVVAASESLTAKGTGTITGMIDTANANNKSSSTLGDTSSLNTIAGNLTINYSAGVGSPNMTNFGGGGTQSVNAFRTKWMAYQ